MSPERPSIGGADRRAEDDRDAARRRLAARIGGIALHLRHDSNAIAAHARAGLLAKFERMADPEGVLDHEARLKKARLLMRQHMSRLALKSMRKRTNRADSKSRPGDQRTGPSDTNRFS